MTTWITTTGISNVLDEREGLRGKRGVGWLIYDEYFFLRGGLSDEMM